MERETFQFRPTDQPREDYFGTPARPGVSRSLRFAWIFAGVLMPIVSFVVGTTLFARGASSLSNCAGRLLSLDGSLPLFPLLLICMISLIHLASAPEDLAHNGWVRLGIFSGVILSFEYWVVFQTAMSDTRGANSWRAATYQCFWGAIWSPFAVLLAWIGLRMLVNVVSIDWRTALPSAFGLLILALLVIVSLPWSLLILVALCLYCSTPWAVAVYLSAAVWLVRRRKGAFLQFTLWQLLAATTWLAAHFAAWRSAILLMLEKNAAPPH